MTTHAIAQRSQLTSLDAPPAPGPSRVRALARRLLTTPADAAATLARLSLAVLVFPHGGQHALGWFGGYGFTGTHAWMTKTLGFPAAAAALAVITEIVAPFALAVGLGGRLAALGVIGIMLGAISTHAASGFFMNWFAGLPAGQEGFEYHLVVIALAAVVVLKGSGALSTDRALATRL